MQRPVICVCNDLHAPVLRPLKAVAELVEFRGSSNAQLAARLKHVCKQEKLATDAHTLNTLCNLAQHDVRSCLNALQFIRAKSQKLTEATMAAAPVGKKTGKNPMELWRQVFISNAPAKRKGVGAVAAAAAKSGFAGQRTEAEATAAANKTPALRLMDDLSRADTEFVLEGVVENYLSVPYTDPLLNRTADAAEWLADHDTRTHTIFTKGHFGLLPYAEATVLAMHTQCNVPFLHDKLAWPRTAREARARATKQATLLKSWQAGLAPALFNCYTASSLASEVLSPLLAVLTPSVRPAAAHLLSSDERRTITDLIDHMISHGLRFRQVQNEEGVYVHRLDPPVAELLAFSNDQGGEGLARAELPAVVRQMISTEMTRELLRRSHGSPEKAGGGLATGGSNTPLKARPPPVPTARMPKELPAEAAAPVVSKDMFGRPVVKKQQGVKRASALSSASPSSGQAMYRFKFHEGVTDAVRRTVRVRDLR